MFSNIHFIGGVHGSGKGTSSREIYNNTELIYLEASKVLKWENLSSQQNKKVINIEFTQNRLLFNLSQIIKPETSYLLDGHYCLINENNEIERIEINTFEKINPKSLSIKIDEPVEIKKRLQLRDDKDYDLDFIVHFQNEELKYAKFLSEILKKPLFLLNNDLKNLIKYINHENPS